MFLKRKEKREEPVQEEVVQDAGELLANAQQAVAELKDKSGEERIAVLNEIGILYAGAKQASEAITCLEMSFSEKKDLGKGYRTLLNPYNTKQREAAKAKDDEQIQYYLRKIDKMTAISKEVTRASFQNRKRYSKNKEELGIYKSLIGMFRENKGGETVEAFDLHYSEMLPAMIAATQELETPIIIQASLGTAEYVGFEALIAAVKTLTKKTDISVCLHMDHCKSIKALRKAIDLRYSSVMYDDNDLPLEENIKNTQGVVAYARERNAPVEGEIGSIGRAEDDVVVKKSDAAYTKPADAIRFIKETDVDALAVAIETTHGQYKSKANTDYELLETLQDKLPDIGLILHSGTGVSDEDMKRCVKGMKKINVGMELNKSYTEEVNTSFPDATPLTSLRKLFTPTNDHIRRVITKKSTLSKM